MLLDNFRPLLFFGNGGTFVNVLGDTVDLSSVLTKITENSILNGHSYLGVARSFNYTTNIGSNSYTEEQTSYTWLNITSSMNTRDQAYYRNGFVIFIGTGDTAVTASDYCLDSALNIDVVGASCTTADTGIVTTTRTFENNTGSDVEIKEMGLYIFTPVGEGAQYMKPLIMIGRKVLANPVTIPEGEQRTFEYVIHMENITFSDID